MSTISSIYAQSANSIYEASSLFKNSKITGMGNSDNKSSVYKEDSLTISSEGLALLQSLKETEETSTESNSTSEDSSDNDVVSQLEKLLESDKLSEQEKTDLSSVIEQLKEKLAATTEEDASTSATSSTTEENRPMMPPPPPQGMPPMMPPMPPMDDTSMEDETDTESTTESTNSTTEDLEDNATTDSKELGKRPPYPMNFEDMISSGLLTEDQASIIKSAFASAIA